MRVLFIRHGDPDYVHDSLTEKGVREAKALAAYLKDKPIDKWYCSPLGRARATASYSLKERGEEAEIRDFLHEFDSLMPDPETGKDRIPWDFFPEVWMAEEKHFDLEHWHESRLYSGTNVKKDHDWVCRELDTLLEEHGYRREGHFYRVDRPNKDTIAIVCHMGITCVMLSHLLNISPVVMMHAAFVSPTALTMVETEERSPGSALFRLRYLGATPHLTLAGEPVSASGMFKEVYDEEPERIVTFPD